MLGKIIQADYPTDKRKKIQTSLFKKITNLSVRENTRNSARILNRIISKQFRVYFEHYRKSYKCGNRNAAERSDHHEYEEC